MNHISSYKVFFMPLPHYNPSLIVLAGRTGSGKSAVLRQLALQGFAVIDLEQLAQHSGSAFGHLPFARSGYSMGFLKSLDERLAACQYEPLVFTECKGASVGAAVLPKRFQEKLQNGFIVHFDVPFNVRLEHLTNAYAHVPVDDFVNAAKKLNGKIAAETLNAVLTFLNAHAYKEAIALLMAYYDNSLAYNHFIEQAHLTIPVQKIDPPSMVEDLTQALMQTHPLFLHCS